MFEIIACKMSRRMASYLNWDEVEEAAFYLGMKVFIHNIRTIAGIALISLFMGVLQETCIVFFVFGFLRLKAGGFHCKESWQCFFVTSLTVIGGVFVAREIGNISGTQIIGVYAILCLMAHMIAPQGTENHPLSFVMKKKGKQETIVCLCIYMILTFVLKDTAGKFIMIGAVLEMVSLIPSAANM